MRRYATPLDLMRNGIELGFILAEANAVVAMRLWGMAGFWSVTASENSRMIAEKAEAAQRGVLGAGLAIAAGRHPGQVAAAAMKPVRRKTRANVRRLAKRGPKLKGH